MSNTAWIFIFTIIGGLLAFFKDWKPNEKRANLLGALGVTILFLSSWKSCLMSDEAEKAQEVAEANSRQKDSLNKAISDSLIKLQSKVIELQSIQLDTAKAILGLSKTAVTKINDQLSQTERLQFPIPDSIFFGFQVTLKNRKLTELLLSADLPKSSEENFIRLLPDGDLKEPSEAAQFIRGLLGSQIYVHIKSRSGKKYLEYSSKDFNNEWAEGGDKLFMKSNGYIVNTTYPYNEITLLWGEVCRLTEVSPTAVSLADVYEGQVTFNANMNSDQSFDSNSAFQLTDYSSVHYYDFTYTNVFIGNPRHFSQLFKKTHFIIGRYGVRETACNGAFDFKHDLPPDVKYAF